MNFKLFLRCECWLALFLLYTFSFKTPFLYSDNLKTTAVVAAENFYGHLAQEIGKEFVSVTSIMSHPKQDPHLFSITPQVIITFSTADIVIYNGLNYDPWAKNILDTSDSKPKFIINVSELMGKKEGDNPHIWYDPHTMPTLAQTYCQLFGHMDPLHAADFEKQKRIFIHEYDALWSLIARIKERHRDAVICATEPLFNYMASALELRMKGSAFQVSIMNDIQPSISAVKDFEDLLNRKLVKALIYNTQVFNPVANRMVTLAQKNGIPAIGMSEMQPLHETYIEWMMAQLEQLEKALEGHNIL